MAARGLRVFQLPAGQKEARTRGWPEVATLERERIAGFDPAGNYGYTLDGFVAIDIDHHGDDDGPASWRALCDRLGLDPDPDTLTVTTPNEPGRHVVFRLPEGLTVKTKSGWLPGVDVKSGPRTYLVGPGSFLTYVGTYRMVNDSPVALIPGALLAALPVVTNAGSEPAVALVTHAEPVRDATIGVDPLETSGRTDAYASAALSDASRSVATAPNGARNETLNREAYSMGGLVAGGHLRESEVRESLRAAAATAGLTQAETDKTIESGLTKGKAKPRHVEPAQGGVVSGVSGTAPEAPGSAPLPNAHDRLVAVEVERLRVRDEAAALVQAERDAARPPRPRLEVATVREVLARDPEPAHRIEGLIPWEASTLLVGQRKTGKTTIVLNLVNALLTGEAFLGRFDVQPLTGTVAILNFEVSGATFARWTFEHGVELDRVHLVNLRGRPNPLANLADRAALGAMLREREVEAIVVDPFGRAFPGDSQNDAGEVTSFLTGLDTFVRSEAGATDLILTTHAGWDGTRSRGSTALEDWPDSIITLTQDAQGARFLRAIGRDVEVEEDRLEFDPATRTLTLTGAGSRKVQASTEKLAALVAKLLAVVDAHPGRNQSELEGLLRKAGASFQKGDVGKAVQAAVRNGQVYVEDGPNNQKLVHPSPSRAATPSLPELPHGDAPSYPSPPIDVGGAGKGSSTTSHPDAKQARWAS